MAIAAVGVHQPKLSDKIGRRIFAEDDLFPIGRPRLPKGRMVRSQVRKLFHIATIGIHGVDIRAGNEGDTAVLTVEGGGGGNCCCEEKCPKREDGPKKAFRVLHVLLRMVVKSVAESAGGGGGGGGGGAKALWNA